jgi:hypothetical protein
MAARKTGSRLGIVRRQIYCRMGSGEVSNRVQRCTGNPLISAHAVQRTREHQALTVRCIAIKKVCCVVLLDQDGDMIRSVTGRGDRDNVPSMRQSPAASEGPNPFRCEFKRRWIEP